MPTTLSPVNVCNIALGKIGAQPIQDITDLTNASAIACNTHFDLVYQSTSRAREWNCLMDPAVLTEQTQTPLPGAATPTPAPNWEIYTFYAANTYLTYGGYVYIVMYDYTSTNNFFNDLTTGALTQTNYPSNGNTFDLGNGSDYPSGWAYKFALPSDFLYLAVLNDNVYWDYWSVGSSEEYQIMGDSLYCNASQAVIKYVKNQPDTTRWDPMLTEAISFKLASAVATQLRQDGGKLEMAMLQAYNVFMTAAATKNAGERKPRRFNIISSSRFNAARFGGVNG